MHVTISTPRTALHQRVAKSVGPFRDAIPDERHLAAPSSAGRRCRHCLAVLRSQMPVSFECQVSPSLCPNHRATVGMSTPDSMHLVAKRWRRSWWVRRFARPLRTFSSKPFGLHRPPGRNPLDRPGSTLDFREGLSDARPSAG